MAADDDLDVLVSDLVGVLRELETTLEPETVAGVPRPPTPREFARFTSEVAIPGAILVLRTNIETLRLLQRTLRMAEGRTGDGNRTMVAVGERARSVSRRTLSRLDDALADLQGAVEGRPEDAEARDMLARARDLRDEVDARLAAASEDDAVETAEVPVDVEAELQSIKRAVGDDGGGVADANGEPGDDETVDAGDSGSDADVDGSDSGARNPD